MSWRSVQLGSELCDQDQLIIRLFNNQPVKYAGNDQEFAANLTCDATASNLILILNQPLWLSEVVDRCQQLLVAPIDTFYIGLNRYCVKGNDTSRNFISTGARGADLVDCLESVINKQGYEKKESGYFDDDLGRYFNFVQPLTWIYGTQKANTNH
jgi:hypothetical protein